MLRWDVLGVIGLRHGSASSVRPKNHRQAREEKSAQRNRPVVESCPAHPLAAFAVSDTRIRPATRGVRYLYSHWRVRGGAADQGAADSCLVRTRTHRGRHSRWSARRMPPTQRCSHEFRM